MEKITRKLLPSSSSETMLQLTRNFTTVFGEPSRTDTREMLQLQAMIS